MLRKCVLTLNHACSLPIKSIYSQVFFSSKVFNFCDINFLATPLNSSSFYLASCCYFTEYNWLSKPLPKVTPVPNFNQVGQNFRPLDRGYIIYSYFFIMKAVKVKHFNVL